MEQYVKANRKVAEFLHLQNDRSQLKDGSFLLWMQDVMAFGSLVNFRDILAQIGAVALTGEEARNEQNGIESQALPVATDERFIIEEQSSDDTSSEESSSDESSSDESSSGEDTSDKIPSDEVKIEEE